MDQKNQWYKQKFIDSLFQREFTPIVRGNSYVVRCPYCGDSSDPRKAHFYITIDMEQNTPILYNCFRCPAGGVMNKEVMEMLGMDNSELTNGIKVLNRTTERYDANQINSEEVILNFDYQLPEIRDGRKLNYIRDRLHLNFTNEDFKEMKVITSFREFLQVNHIKKLTCDKWIASMYERDYIGFLSHGNSHILFRDITGQNEIPWVKYPITEASRRGKIFYSISSSIDIFTKEEIVINLSEGVFDALGVYYHFHYQEPNVINIAVTGKYHLSVIYYLIRIGICGYNVTLNIYSDNDQKFNKKRQRTSKKNEDDTSLAHYQKLFQHVKYLFKSVYVYYNEIGKDCGVPKDEISLVRYKL